MSDLPPDGPGPQQPAGPIEATPAAPYWARPAAPAPEVPQPAPGEHPDAGAEPATPASASTWPPQPARVAGEVQAWANDPAVAQVPPQWAGPSARAADDATSGAAGPDSGTRATTAADPAAIVAPAPGLSTPVANPPAGWYVPVPASAPGRAPSTGASPALGQSSSSPVWSAPTGAATPAQAPAWTAASAAAPASMARTFSFDRARWLPTLVVGAIIAAVTLGGLGLDKVIAAPSAGTVAIGGSVTITAASGWVLITPEGDTSGGIQLQKANVVLTAQVVSSNYSGTSAAMISEAERELSSESAQISYGDAHRGTISGNDTSYVAFEATMTSGQQSGIVDGELVCMVVGSNETILVVAAPQGHLESVVDEVSEMLKSVRVGR